MNYFGIIYKAVNNVNDKVYIGQTTGKFNIRRLRHLNDSEMSRDNTYFHNAIKKYGFGNFKWAILKHCCSREELDSEERRFIQEYEAFKNGYNLTLGGGGMSGYLITEGHRLNLSESHRGYKHTEKQKKRIVKALTGRPCLEETRRKLSISKLGKNNPMYGRIGEKNPFYGKKHSDDSKFKLADSKSFYWRIIFPDGQKEVIKNLNSFCRENNLDKSAMEKVSKGERRHHKGYKCERLGKLI